MKTITFNHGNTEYQRINRTKAIKALKAGYVLVVFGRMDNPNSPLNSPCFWSMGDERPDGLIGLPWDGYCEMTFNRLENSFEYYTGKKPWWYLPSGLVEKL